MRPLLSLILVAVACLVFGPPVAYSAPLPRDSFIQVEHNVTFPTQFFPDDICGTRAVFETVTYKTAVFRITTRPDGTLHLTDVEVGSVFHNFVDPSIPDATTQLRHTIAFNITPGGTVTRTETFRQAGSIFTIRSLFHVTVVDGVPKVDRTIEIVRGCS